MILNKEKNDGSERKLLSYLKKIFWNLSKFWADTIAKISQNLFAYSFVWEHSKQLSFYFKKKNNAARRVVVNPTQPPPPPLDGVLPASSIYKLYVIIKLYNLSCQIVLLFFC